MTPVETLTNLGKLLGYMGVAMFMFLTVLAQYAYWFKHPKVQMRDLPKRWKILSIAGFWECAFFACAGALFIVIAVTRVLWDLVVKGW